MARQQTAQWNHWIGQSTLGSHLKVGNPYQPLPVIADQLPVAETLERTQLVAGEDSSSILSQRRKTGL